jgi:hypothetical protein
VVADAEGTHLFEAEILDFEGNPLAGLEVSYLHATPSPLIAFNHPETGEPAGTFLIDEETALGSSGVSGLSGDQAVPLGVFVLSLFDPTLGRLYDPERDGFSPRRNTNIDGIRRVLNYEDIMLVLESTPGLVDRGVKKKSELPTEFHTDILRYLVREGVVGDPIHHRIARFALFSLNHAPSYRYRYFSDATTKTTFVLPLGVQASVAFTSPENDRTYSSPRERSQPVAGTVDVSPEVVSSDGGRMDLQVNGSVLHDVIALSGDGRGGTLFEGVGELQLVEGENTIEVLAYASVSNRGLENDAGGLAGSARVLVRYEPQDGPFPPVFSDLNYPTTRPCPEGVLSITFHYSDPDGDIDRFYEHTTVTIGGETVEQEASAPIDAFPALSCLTGIEGDCSFELTYSGIDGGDGVQYEFWVTDATGLESNHLTVDVAFTGNCGSGGLMRAPTGSGVRSTPGSPRTPR